MAVERNPKVKIFIPNHVNYWPDLDIFYTSGHRIESGSTILKTSSGYVASYDNVNRSIDAYNPLELAPNKNLTTEGVVKPVIDNITVNTEIDDAMIGDIVFFLEKHRDYIRHQSEDDKINLLLRVLKKK